MGDIFCFEQNILRFKIPVGNSMVMQLSDSLADLQDNL